jgi:nucleoside phosphorylase
LETPIVQPPSRGDKPPIPPWIVMVATIPDLQRLRQRLSLMGDKGEPLYMSRIYRGPEVPARFGLVGPFMGAPQAAMLMETLSAWGGNDFLFWGWCGAIDPRLRTGDIVLPSAAFIDEGTSRGYGIDSDRVDLPSWELHGEIKNALAEDGIAFEEGAVWSTDAVFRETPSKVRAFRKRGAVAVEMEISACLTVAHLRGVRFAAALTVSDELSDLRWRPGFRDPRFQAAGRSLSRIVERLCLIR